MTDAVTSLDGRQVIWTPTPRQRIALTCPADEVMYGGAKGGGKSDMLLNAPNEQIHLAHAKWKATGRRQRGRAILFRRNLRNLDDLIQRSKELFPEIDPGAEWFKVEKRWVFSSGYRFDFAHLDGPEDHEAYQGQEITALLFDQVEEIAEAVYQFLTAQVRSSDEDMRKLLIIRCSANPGGRHAQWVKDYFVSPHRSGNRIIREEKKLSRGRSKVVTKAFIPARLADNPYLDADGAYEANLRRLPAHMQQMYLDGDWDTVVGSHFASLWNKSIHVVPAFSIPPTWRVKFGMDWGSTNPACCEFGTLDNDGNLYIIDEIYGPGKTGRAFGERILQKFERQKWSDDKRWTKEDVYGLLDWQAWADHGAEGPTAAQTMVNMGIRLFKANKNRKAGMEQIRDRLTITDGAPKVFIFDRCTELIRTLPQLMTDPHDPEDIEHPGQEDHGLDAMRYLAVDWPVGSTTDNARGDHDVERWLNLARERDRASQSTESVTGYE
jgi:hypothetical protein